MANNGIAASGFLDGFMRGYDFIDKMRQRQSEEQRQKQLDADNKQYRDASLDLQRQGLALQGRERFSAPVEGADPSGSPAYFQIGDQGTTRGIAGYRPIVTPKAGTITYKNNGQEVTRLTENGVPVGAPIGLSAIREAPKPTDTQRDFDYYSRLSPEQQKIFDRMKGRAGSGELPLPPQQILAQAGVARRNALSAVISMLEKDSSLGNSPGAQKSLLEQVYAEELSALGLDQEMVNQASGNTGRSAPGQGGSAGLLPESSPIYAPAPVGLTGIPGATTYRTPVQSAEPGRAGNFISGPVAPQGTTKTDKNGVRVQSLGNGQWQIVK
ncbi:MAG: hypothetical protein EPN60_05320 [Nevskiaceae bacterium]|nr:MAG: hypothetical protein EPN60_05320 [Nevskiaceae bacterium]